MELEKFVRKVSVFSVEDFQVGQIQKENLPSIITRNDRPLALVNRLGKKTTSIFVVQISTIKELEKSLLFANDFLFKNPHAPGIVVVKSDGKIEGLIERSTIANELDALSARDILHELAGSPQNVPFVVYKCPEGDYEFVPFEGEPDHLCPTHKLHLVPNWMSFNV